MGIQIADFLIHGVLFWFVIALLVLQAFNLIVHKDVPNIRTAPAIRRRIIQIIGDEAKFAPEKRLRIVDMGAGNGLLTREIAASFPMADVLGIEIAPHTYAWADWMRKRSGLKNLRYEKRDFFTADLTSADIVIIYSIPFYLRRMAEKLQAELPVGSLILSNKFELQNGWVPLRSEKIETLYLHQKDLQIYRKAADQPVSSSVSQ